MANYNDVWYTSTDGLTLYARDYGAKNSKATILCLHGLTRNSADFHDIGCYLSDSHYRVIVADQRGRGRSEYDPNTDNYLPGTYVQDMFALLDSLQLERVILMGTSMGGIMSMFMAMMAPDIIQAVILNDIGPDINPEGMARVSAYVGKLPPVENWEEAVSQTRQAHEKDLPGLSERQWLAFTQGLYQKTADGQFILAYDPGIKKPFEVQGNSAPMVDLWEPFAAISAKPMLLIHGGLSDVLASDCVEQMQSIKPDLQYCQLTDRGHAPLLNERESVKAIDSFLASLSFT